MNAHPTLVSWAVYLLLNLTLLGASLALGVAIAFRFIPTSLPRARYFITLAAFCAASLLPILATMGVTARQPSALVPPEATRRATTSDNASLTDLAPAIEPAMIAPASFRNSVLDFARRLNEHPLAAVLLWLWLSVSTLLLGRELIGHLRLWRARRTWELATATLQQTLNWPQNIPLYLHQHSGPSTIGCLRPAVVLPQRLLSDLSSTAISRIARHELAHARWRDPLANALLRLLRALLWPSLPLWFLEHLTYTEREAAADQAAIADRQAEFASQQSALDYAALLLSIAEWERAVAARSFSLLGTQAGGRKALENRIYRLLKTSPRLNPARAALGLAALLAGLMTIGLLPAAVAERRPAPGKSAGADATLVVKQPESQAMAKPLTAKRAGSPASLDKASAAERKTPVPEEVAQATPSPSVREWKPLAIDENEPPPPNRIVFNKYGPGSAVIVRQTVEGESEEPILQRSEAEMRAAAIEQASLSYPQEPVSGFPLTPVMVFVLVDEDGHVISARPMPGQKSSLLEPRAVEAARQWKFTPATMAGKPIKMYGVLTFSLPREHSQSWAAIK